jgi:hypothetical protein
MGKQLVPRNCKRSGAAVYPDAAVRAAKIAATMNKLQADYLKVSQELSSAQKVVGRLTEIKQAAAEREEKLLRENKKGAEVLAVLSRHNVKVSPLPPSR